MPNFEVFTKRGSTTATDAIVTIQKNGAMALSKPAYDLLHGATHVELLFDAEERIIGLRGVAPETPHAYPLRHTESNPGQWLVSALAFMKFYGLRFGVSQRFPAFVDDGVLCVDLKVEGTEVVGNRSNGRSSYILEDGEE